MKGRAQASAWFIGWDVGGWNCERNSKSRDAIVILDADLNVVGKPWWGSLRPDINAANDTQGFVAVLFARCGVKVKIGDGPVTLAIDTPLGFPERFVRLATRLQAVGELGSSGTNPYLFRQTELQLFAQGLKPLSAIKDMIGSQATKGMHVLAKFTPTATGCGVWRGGRLTAIEAYPAACKNCPSIRALRKPFGKLSNTDLDDALMCALVAYLFAERRDALLEPESSVPETEGWIWLPKDALPSNERNPVSGAGGASRQDM